MFFVSPVLLSLVIISQRLYYKKLFYVCPEALYSVEPPYIVSLMLAVAHTIFVAMSPHLMVWILLQQLYKGLFILVLIPFVQGQHWDPPCLLDISS